MKFISYKTSNLALLILLLLPVQVFNKPVAKPSPEPLVPSIAQGLIAALTFLQVNFVSRRVEILTLSWT